MLVFSGLEEGTGADLMTHYEPKTGNKLLPGKDEVTTITFSLRSAINLGLTLWIILRNRNRLS